MKVYSCLLPTPARRHSCRSVMGESVRFSSFVNGARCSGPNLRGSQDACMAWYASGAGSRWISVT
ncbi:hypothetical protein [Methanogenium organophilum]|uniref:Uncharacterized protein n=1 Tax=Methanogenium organophilum TaxID=2199 RepID=A0A9X9T7M0_METOG|nr:hypothetical protein [Methanogenium organophilum]WAI00536.1 hypothetical protein OU421_08850 [Methanogenium organophilum]